MRKAQAILDNTFVSRLELISKLFYYHGFTEEQAVYGVDHSGADWFEQAAKQAQIYAYFYPRDELIRIMEDEGYTHEQAVYGADKSGL